MTEQPPQPQQYPAGWYDDPDGGGGKRYFDGTQWTEDRAPAGDPAAGTAPYAAPATTADGKSTEVTGVIIAGYVLAVLIPIIGLIIGFTQMNKNVHGTRVIIVSVAVMVLSFLLILSSGG